MKFSILHLGLTFAALTSLAAPPGQANDGPIDLWGKLDKGSYMPGFRVIDISDSARPTLKRKPRPIQVSVWYPATADPGVATLRYQDYARVTASEISPATEAEKQETIEGYREFLIATGSEASGAEAWLEARMAGVMNAAPAAGTFPVVLIAQGMGGAVPDQALLGEYLASHGWVVATSPSQARLGNTTSGRTGVFRAAGHQARDLDLILTRLRSFTHADTGRAAVIGYSFGARGALLFALRKPSIRALVSIDGGIGSRNDANWLRGTGIDPTRLVAPVMHFYEDTESTMVSDFRLFSSMKKSDRLLVKVADMRHLDFITFGMATALVRGVDPSRGPVPNRDLENRFTAVLRYTHAFLEAHVAGSVRDEAFLSRDPSENDFGKAIPRVIRMPKGR